MRRRSVRSAFTLQVELMLIMASINLMQWQQCSRMQQARNDLPQPPGTLLQLGLLTSRLASEADALLRVVRAGLAWLDSKQHPLGGYR